MGCYFRFQGIFPTQGLNPHLLHWRANSLPVSHLGSPDDEMCAFKDECHVMFLRLVWKKRPPENMNTHLELSHDGLAPSLPGEANSWLQKPDCISALLQEGSEVSQTCPASIPGTYNSCSERQVWTAETTWGFLWPHGVSVRMNPARQSNWAPWDSPNLPWIAQSFGKETPLKSLLICPRSVSLRPKSSRLRTWEDCCL